jgi:hypothetical protein
MRDTVKESLYVLNTVLLQTPLSDWVQSITQAKPDFATPMPGGDFVAFIFLVDKPIPRLTGEEVLELVSCNVFVYPGPDADSAYVVLGVPLEVLGGYTNLLSYKSMFDRDMLCRN